MALDSGNEASSEVLTPGGDDAVFSLFFGGWEFNDPDYATMGGAKPGDLNTMAPYMELQPIGPGGTVHGACDFIDPLPNPVNGYEQTALFQCGFTSVPVNTYVIAALVYGEEDDPESPDFGRDVYYNGEENDVFTVFDPSLGFTTGGGWFYWPDSNVPEDACLEYVDEEQTECLVPDPCRGYPGDKTSFGFNLQYNKKRNNAKGSLLMMRHTIDENCLDAGSYRVKSNAIEGMALGEGEDANGTYGWASASGKASFREPGFDDEGNYSFLLYVEDHGEQGCGQDPADEFWLEVRDKDGNIVDALSFDGAPVEPSDGESDGDDEPIACGNIVVPQKTGKGGGGGSKGPNPKKPPKG